MEEPLIKTIKCPHCGAEYLPSEIFMPEDLLDKTYTIHKTKDGIIEFAEGKDAELIESYICDYCDKQFIVVADINFISMKDDVEEEYVTKL